MTGVEFIADLIKDGLFDKSQLERDGTQVENQFKGGKLAVWIGGPWVLGSLDRADDKTWVPAARKNVGVAPMPTGPQGKAYTFVGGSDLMMFKSTKHPNEAWALMKFLSEDQIQKDYAKLLGMFPARLEPQKQVGESSDANHKAFFEAIQQGRTYAPIPQWGQIENAYKTRFGNILDRRPAGKASNAEIEKQLDAAAKEADGLLAQTHGLAGPSSRTGGACRRPARPFFLMSTITPDRARCVQVIAEPERRRGGSLQRSRRRLIIGLIAPAVVFMVLVHLLPTIGGFFLSFKSLNTFTFRRLFDAPWAGLENYRGDPLRRRQPAARRVLGAPSRTRSSTRSGPSAGRSSAGSPWRCCCNRPMRGHRLVRTLMLTPWIVPSFVVAVLWQFMWQSDVGIINKVLVDYTHILGDRPIWLLGHNSMWAIIIPSIWRGLPFAMLIFLAGLQAMPRELHEAAAIDGAGPFRRFRYITLPLLRPLIAVQLLFGVIYAAYQFAIPYVMLGSNPGPDADLMMTLIVRQSFSNNLFGFGGAASTLLMLAMFVWVADLVPRVQARPGGRMTALTLTPRARKRMVDGPRRPHLARPAGDALADHLARRLLAAERPPARRPARYDLLHPTLTAFSRTCGRRSTSSATSSTA